MLRINLKNIFSLLTFISIVIFSTSSSAMEGFYVGGGANYNWLNADYTANNYIIDTVFGRDDVGHGSGDFSGNNAGGQVVAGYTWGYFNKCCEQLFFVSLEGFAEFYSIKGDAAWESPQVTLTLDQNLEAKLKNGFGVSLKPGMMLTDSMSVFGIVGYVYSQLDDIVYDTDLKLYNNAGVSDFDKKGLSGLRLGLGSQYHMTENLVAELSWAINFYQDYDHLNEYNTGQVGGSTYYEDVEINSIMNNQVFLNLIYYFD